MARRDSLTSTNGGLQTISKREKECPSPSGKCIKRANTASHSHRPSPSNCTATGVHSRGKTLARATWRRRQGILLSSPTALLNPARGSTSKHTRAPKRGEKGLRIKPREVSETTRSKRNFPHLQVHALASVQCEQAILLSPSVMPFPAHQDEESAKETEFFCRRGVKDAPCPRKANGLESEGARTNDDVTQWERWLCSR